MGIHQDGESDLVALHDTLLDGAKVELQFESMSEFYSFRTMLYRYKNYYESLLSGIYSEEENQKKSILIEAGNHTSDHFIYTFQFGQKTDKKKYKFKIIEDEEQSEAAE